MQQVSLVRSPGISFIIRCRNEQDHIEACITSLKAVTVPHELIVVLHQCTDDSRRIVERLRGEGYPIRLYEYQQDISRAGYENLVTPAAHPQSLVTYYNFSVSKARYNWMMKWDADFTATPELVDCFNQLDIADTTPTNVRIGCRLGDSGVVNKELYLSSALIGYDKYVFWEVPRHQDGVQEIVLETAEIQSISYQVLKPYWHIAPWFSDPTTGDSAIQQRYDAAVSILGPEPAGMARASNPECDDIFRQVFARQAELEAAGINLFG